MRVRVAEARAFNPQQMGDVRAGARIVSLESKGGAGVAAFRQHSTTLTAKPPWLVSLYFDDISRPVWRMVSMT